MSEASYRKADEQVGAAIGRFLDENYPSLDRPEHRDFVALANAFEARSSKVAVKIGDVYFMKLLCEAIFRDNIVPAFHNSRKLLRHLCPDKLLETTSWRREKNRGQTFSAVDRLN